MLAVFVLLLSSGCAARSPIPRYTAPAAGITPPASRASLLGPAYKLDTGDRLQIRFPYHDELDSLTTVRPDGRLTVTGLGEFLAFGLTTDELERDIYRRASLTHRNPEAYVLVAEAREVKAYVGGEVQRPGYVAVRPGLTSLRAVLERGGFLSSAKVGSVLHIRWDANGAYTAKLVDLKHVLETGDTSQDIVVAANDVVYVPATAIANANLWVRQYITDLLPVRAPGTPDIGGSK
jgi:protein involved in polysaccharide export with SLBB domain